jgi:hypothetical protein
MHALVAETLPQLEMFLEKTALEATSRLESKRVVPLMLQDC